MMWDLALFSWILTNVNRTVATRHARKVYAVISNITWTNIKQNQTKKVEKCSINSSLEIHGWRSRATIYNGKNTVKPDAPSSRKSTGWLKSCIHEQRFKTVRLDSSNLTYVKSQQAALNNGNVTWANIKQTHKHNSKLPDVMILIKLANNAHATTSWAAQKSTGDTD
jgi:hypothetical protein